jgi:hypothetical protein
MNTKDIILDYIKSQGEVSAKLIIEYTKLTPQTVHRYLKTFLGANLVIKIGSTPRVYYRINHISPPSPTLTNTTQIPKKELEIIEKNFIQISPTGHISKGFEAFQNWCNNPSRRFDPEKSALQYVELLKKYEKLKDKHGFINANSKMKDAFSKNYFLDDTFSIDYYSLPQFGKTPLANKLLYAKQSSDREFIQEVIDEVKPKIYLIIQKLGVDALGFVPPTIPRNIQFMKVLQREIKTNLPIISLTKIAKTQGNLVIQQKSLKKIQDRQENARDSIFINDSRVFRKVLLIDDFIGSGTTLNEIAKKLKHRNLATKIYGFGITVSLNGFEVINEV